MWRGRSSSFEGVIRGYPGTEIVADTPDQFGAFMKLERVKWSKVLKQTGIRLD